MNPENCKVALLYGGTSGERSISIASGEGSKAALIEAGYQVTMIDTAEKAQIMRLFSEDFDVAFLCLHGKMGEDGTVQGLLEYAGIPYTGSGVLSSALSMDKAKAKVMYEAAGLPTPPSIYLERGKPYVVDEIVQKLGVPCVVKPATEGSALGVFIVEREADLKHRIEEAFAIDDHLVVEKYIKGVELTAAVLGNEDTEALPVIEIVPSHEFYDFESKYAPGGSQHICPARLSDGDTARVQQLAIDAHKVLGCLGVSRTDMIQDAEGEIWLLETNTIPGMTSTSLLPDAARAIGLDFPRLCSKLVELALEGRR
ncbi:MAG: D-alanine--D-alanine ligase [Berryella intestinalis]|uniref:D-alanine--D-alanine ligase family protein n=1 Tax=Berryella intestinalis TaxID=1531429 RepID=UPI002A52E493|nr:D-alanine--D-alanine ligase [Berryella intestinalis]MDD7368794.1 D-alanine--D-alanine ligase [Berryella intestinalis]MDY3128988.1 D-alanine--D-alanine ligase [Berryella intestinalis]